MDPSPARTVDAYREHFARSLVGRWSTVTEFAPGPQSEWLFESDGTGYLRSFSGMNNGMQLVKWREAGEQTVEVQTSDLVEFVSREPPANAVFEWSDEQEHWMTISYDFVARERYGVALFQTPEHELFKFPSTFDYLYLLRERPQAEVDQVRPETSTSGSAGAEGLGVSPFDSAASSITRFLIEVVAWIAGPWAAADLFGSRWWALPTAIALIGLTRTAGLSVLNRALEGNRLRRCRRWPQLDRRRQPLRR